MQMKKQDNERKIIVFIGDASYCANNAEIIRSITLNSSAPIKTQNLSSYERRNKSGRKICDNSRQKLDVYWFNILLNHQADPKRR